MPPIENIMKLRKGYALKLYEYFKHVQNKFEEKIAVIRAESDGIYQEENLIWKKLQEKKNTLEKFENEIKSLSEAKGVIDKKRLIEVTSLREKLELKYQDTELEYNQFLKHIFDKQNQWYEESQTILLNGAKRQKVLVRLHDAVTSTYPDLKEYCSHWKDEPISRLNKIIKDSNNIEQSCLSILNEIASISLLNMDQQHLIDKKIAQIPKSCQSLYKELEIFINNPDYLDIFEKTKAKDEFVGNFLNIFKDNSFTSIRNTIRIVHNVVHTEKKINIILENFQQIEMVFQQVLDNLFNKKDELMSVCVDADLFALETCNKWLQLQYQADLNIVEQIKQKRNEFVVNETIL